MHRLLDEAAVTRTTGGRPAVAPRPRPARRSVVPLFSSQSAQITPQRRHRPLFAPTVSGAPMLSADETVCILVVVKSNQVARCLRAKLKDCKRYSTKDRTSMPLHALLYETRSVKRRFQSLRNEMK